MRYLFILMWCIILQNNMALHTQSPIVSSLHVHMFALSIILFFHHEHCNNTFIYL